MLLPSQPAARVRRQAASVQTWPRRLVGLRQRKVSRGLSQLDKLSFSWQRAEGYIRSPNVYARYVLCMFGETRAPEDEVRFLMKHVQYLTFNSIF